MNEENDIFSNKLFLKKINKNFNHLIELIQSKYKPLSLSIDQSFERKEISLEFFREFNGSNSNEQIHLLSNILNPEQLWRFLTFNPTDYQCQTFLQEFYELILNFVPVKQHLSYYIEDFLLILSISYDDHLRYESLKIVSLLIENPQLNFKYLNRICYENLYDFDIYYEKIRSYTIESRIIYISKENLNNSNEDNQISKAIDQLGGSVFFKMHRSPKDAYSNLSKLINNQWNEIWGLKSNENSQKYFMKIKNVFQLKMLLKASHRLQEDLQESPLEVKLILRKWVDDLSDEYRCFVCHGKLNAVSACANINNQNQIRDLIHSNFFRNILLSIPYSHAIIDCSIDFINNQVIIIEINPFSKRSSAGKYSWIIDKEILYNHFDTHGFVNIRF